LADHLSANLAVLRSRDPDLAERVAGAEPAALEWSDSKKGPTCAKLIEGGKAITLCSRYDPVEEARRLTSEVDMSRHAGIIVLGFGVGHHVSLLAEQLDEEGVLVVFEPDVGLLRANFEKQDQRKWLTNPRVVLVDGAVDRSGVLTRLEVYSSDLTQGTILVTHPPSRQRHGEQLEKFGNMVADVMAYCRTNMATALVNTSRTTWNQALNAAYYHAGASTCELHNAAAGFPAICVSAGPSLARNVHLLQDPDVRRRVIVITAQTTLRPLLDRGIKPDFVTALDYHEISKRFYEGLPELPDVTLVAEPLGNPTIIDSFPGPVRLTPAMFLDKMLGPDLRKNRVAVRQGATVAHLSFYLAQHLGCDPIMFIGQDLGFSDGLYYSPGVAYHDVWAPEFNAFNTLEMLEWQRVVRHRHLLKKFEDVHGKPIYSDEQMITYLKQFERDFAAAPQMIIDATEGGMPKDHATSMPLAEALETYALQDAPKLPIPPMELDPAKLEQVDQRLTFHLGELATLRKLADQSLPVLRGMLEHQRDRNRISKLFAKLERLREKVESHPETFQLIEQLNTIGVYRRARADRAIRHAGDDKFAKQSAQLRRDIDNVKMIIEACDEATRIFQEARQRIASHMERAVESAA